MYGVWKMKDCSDLKKQLVQSLIWSIALYGSESWALKKSEEKTLAAFEMWVWRRMLRISRTERKTNERIREKIDIPESKGSLGADKTSQIIKVLSLEKKKRQRCFGYNRGRNTRQSVSWTTKNSLDRRYLTMDWRKHGYR